MKKINKEIFETIKETLEAHKKDDKYFVYIDTETTGLDQHHPKTKVRLIQIYPSTLEVYYFDLFDQDKEFVFEVINYINSKKNVRWVGHNIKFDIKMLWKLGLNITKKDNIYDTMIMSQLLYNNLFYKHTLKECFQREFDIAIDKTEQSSDWSKILTESQLEYASKDVYLLKKLFNKLRQKIIDNKLNYIAYLECNCIRIIAALEYNGQYINFEKWNSLREPYEKKKQEADDAIQELIVIKNEQLSFFDEYKEKINVSSSKEMLAQLKEKGVGIENTNADTLKILDTSTLSEEAKSLVENLLQYRNADKALSGFISPMNAHENLWTQRVHPNIFQLNNISGRVATKAPNLLNIPRSPEFRSCFEGQGDNWLLDIDYSQIEARLAAWKAEEKEFIELFKSGDDPYSAFAAKERNMTIEEFLAIPKEIRKPMRQSAKSAVLGLIYGMGAQRYKDYCKSQFNIDKTVDEATADRNRFFELFPKLLTWHKKCWNHYNYMAVRKGEIKSIRNINNRILNGNDLGYSLTINFGIQSLATDIIKHAQVEIFDYLEKNYGLPLFDRSPIFQIAYVHDQVTFEGKKEILEKEKEKITELLLKSADEMVNYGVPFKAEPNIGKNWAESH
jgi:DNA polymerase I-like protein with 3'-5' exonuclease and polymerase domains